VSPEQPFRLTLIAGFVLMVAITATYRVRSAATRERLDRRQEGVFILATLRPAGAALWIGVIAYMINPAWMAWAAVPLPSWLRWPGAALLVVAAAFLRWTLGTLGPNLTDTVVTRQAHTLVTRGPYRWVRHPFYDSMAMIIVAVSLLAANWFMLAAGSIVFILLAVRVAIEERNLLARFGDPYRAYQQRTGKFLPRW
jgi:protein-S-isoprenylcysteine O-methyltransferase Ste14